MDIQRRYLNLLKASLLNDLYIENEVRLLYLGICDKFGERPEIEKIANPEVHLANYLQHVRKAKEVGEGWWFVTTPDGAVHDLRNFCETAHSMIGARRIDNIDYCLERIRKESVPGDLIETGVCRGGAVVYMRGYLQAFEMSDRKVWCADSFEGLPKPSHVADLRYDFSAEKYPVLAVSQVFVEEIFRRYGLLDTSVRFLKGWFRDTLPTAPIDQLALLRLDGDLYESTMDALTALYDKVSPGGFVIVDDYGSFESCKLAIHEFRELRCIDEEMVRIDEHSVFWRKAPHQHRKIPR